MTFKELKHYLGKTNKLLRERQRVILMDTSVLRLFHNGQLFDILHGLALVESIGISETEEGRWKVYHSERGETSNLRVFDEEETACDYFIRELHKFWPIQTVKGIIVYPTLVINGFVLRDENTINKFWNLYVGSNNENIDNIWNQCSGKTLGPYHITKKSFFRPCVKSDYDKLKKLKITNISSNGILFIQLKRGEVFDIRLLDTGDSETGLCYPTVHMS